MGKSNKQPVQLRQLRVGTRVTIASTVTGHDDDPSSPLTQLEREGHYEIQKDLTPVQVKSWAGSCIPGTAIYSPATGLGPPTSGLVTGS